MSNFKVPSGENKKEKKKTQSRFWQHVSKRSLAISRATGLFLRFVFDFLFLALLWPLFRQLAAAVRASGRQIKLVELKSPDTVTSGEKSRGAIRVARRENSTGLRDGARAPCVFPLCFSFSLINCLLVQEKFQSDLVTIPLSLGDIIMTGARCSFSPASDSRDRVVWSRNSVPVSSKKKKEKFAVESFRRERYR